MLPTLDLRCRCECARAPGWRCDRRRVLGTIKRMDSDRLKVDVGLPDLADLPYKQAQPRVKHQKQAQTIFAIGQEIVAEITGVTGTGIVQLRMKMRYDHPQAHTRSRPSSRYRSRRQPARRSSALCAW